MPKIEVYEDALFSYIGKRYSDQELEAVLPAAKAELDEPVNEEGIIKIELNDTNRPDLWSTAGLGRLLRVYEGGKPAGYEFISKPGTNPETGERRVKVEPSAASVRPYIVAFAAQGKSVDEAGLKDLIQTQEKLCWNFGQKRRAVAMGIYRSGLITYPVYYQGADPDTTVFTPLGLDKQLTLREILEEHPKGQEYGHIVADAPLFPFLKDAEDQVLSFPPIINSAKIGAVEEGDEELFIELTGMDLRSLLLAANIVACDMADNGFQILPVAVEYPESFPAELEFGRRIVTPYYFQEPQRTSISAVNKLLGDILTPKQIQHALERMGNQVSIDGDSILLSPAPYRNDFLHSVDIIEDVMIGRGMNSFEPELPRDFTVGALTEVEEISRKVKGLMVGQGFQEMIYNYLGSGRDYIYRMSPKMQDVMQTIEEGQRMEDFIQDPSIVRVMNPMSENYEYVRNSIIPSLLSSEAVSGNAVYPHHIFEVGKIVKIDPEQNYGSRTLTSLGFLSADPEAGFNLVYSQLNALAYYMAWDYTVQESQDSRFIPGRSGDIIVGGKKVGVFGELHPAILENWGITMPCSAGELDIEAILEG
jgi:phenylalanyl-tRNA synthetase beta chain